MIEEEIVGKGQISRVQGLKLNMRSDMFISVRFSVCHLKSKQLVLSSRGERVYFSSTEK